MPMTWASMTAFTIMSTCTDAYASCVHPPLADHRRARREEGGLIVCNGIAERPSAAGSAQVS